MCLKFVITVLLFVNAYLKISVESALIIYMQFRPSVEDYQSKMCEPLSFIDQPINQTTRQIKQIDRQTNQHTRIFVFRDVPILLGAFKIRSTSNCVHVNITNIMLKQGYL